MLFLETESLQLGLHTNSHDGLSFGSSRLFEESCSGLSAAIKFKVKLSFEMFERKKSSHLIYTGDGDGKNTHTHSFFSVEE